MRRRGAALRRNLACTVTFITLLTMSLPANARPPEQQPPPPPGLADRDRDRISDGLAADLANRGPQERVDVVVTWTRRPELDVARNAIGPFDVYAEFEVVNGFAASLTAGQVLALSKVPGVFRVEEDFELSIANDEANADFGINQARTDFGVDGAGVVFCVVDTGVDTSHEQLDGGKVVAWHDAINGLPSPYDDQGHGTHVAAILGGDGVGGPNAALYRGVAPGVGIAAAKVLNSAGSGTESQVIQGIDWCISQGVDGISMSLGTPTGSDGNDAVSLAVDNAVFNHGIVSVIAAGNAGDGPETVGSPGAARGAITVGAAAKVADGLRLAGFSSRGPTLDGRLKPDVVSPGVAITAAQANTTSGYVALSGTSMATPFTAGLVALMLDCNAALTDDDIKSTLGSTATDLGPAGADNNWGNGLIDGYAAVASACGGTGRMSLPSHDHVAGTVPTNGSQTHTFEVGTDGVGLPITATILVQGQLICTFGFPGFCFIWEWSPDLDARLLGPTGSVIWQSECPLAGECGSVGQTEVITAIANQAGEYRVEVYAFSGSPNNGLGGGFVMDLFYGPVGAEPDPTNSPPIAANDAYTTDEDTSLAVTAPGVLGNDSDSDGDPLTAAVVSGPGAGNLTLNATGAFTYTPNLNFNGTDSFVYRADDGRGGTANATATITVNPVNDPPLANAGPDQTVTDADGNGSQNVTLNGIGSSDPEGSPLTYSWSANSTVIATGPNPTVALAVGTHSLTLTVNDGQATGTDTVTVTVQSQPPSGTTTHVADLDAASSWNSRHSRWTATVTVLVHGPGHVPIGNVRVTFSLSDGTTKSCATASTGLCVVSKAQAASVSSLTFTVLSLTRGGYTYDPGSNHDPESDSNGSLIVVNRPQ
jgi:serine protease AprX